VTDEHETEPGDLIDQEIEKIVREIGAASAENREPSAEVRAILDRLSVELAAVGDDELAEWLELKLEQATALSRGSG
jgi:hypothetical protein